MTKWIDPPGGWKYGFPKPIPDDIIFFEDWLVSEGYPREEIEKMGDYFFCSQWETEE